MSALHTEDIRFNSSDGTSQAAGYFFTDPGQPPRAILQISHGMCEYIGRYRDFAAFMAAHGFAVCGNDHLGHGATSQSDETDGFLSPKGGRFYMLRDLKTMNGLARSRWPGLPLILLGHSMGSFFARWFAETYPDALDALILSGTGGPNPAAGAGLAMTAMLGKLRGQAYRSQAVHNMAFGAYLKRVENPVTPYDWISRDKEIVAAYANDPKCTFQFTVSAFHELMATLRTVSRPEWAGKIRRDLPIYIFSGDADPVGDYGKGVRTVYGRLKEAGVADLTLKLYPGGRHEMLNETNRAEVYEDVLAWCEAHLAAPGRGVTEQKKEP